MRPTEEVTNQPLTRKRVAVLLVALCVLVGGMAGTLGLIPTATPSSGGTTGGSGAATDAATATDGAVAASDNSAAAENTTNASGDSAKRVSDCDLIDIDGDNNTASVDIGNNTTADGATIQYRCGTGNATMLDHDLIDVDGNNNSVTVVAQVENGTVVFGESGDATSSRGLYVALQCKGDTSADCDAVDIDGHNNSVTLIMQSDDGRTVHEFGSNSSNTIQTEGMDSLVASQSR